MAYPPLMERICSFPECGRPHSCKGLCAAHYDYQRRYGRLKPIRFRFPASMTPYERLMARTAEDGDCIVYTGRRDPHGYGRLPVNGKPMLAHRVMMEHHHGPSPLHVLHSCNNPPCVNVDHLRYGTVQENMMDAVKNGSIAPRRFLTEDEVRAIIGDARPQKVIAAEYGCHQSHVSKIKSRSRRKEIA